MDIQLISNRWTALVFGAVFNFLSAGVTENLIEYAIKTLIGGLVWFGFQVAADRMKKRGEAAAKKEQDKNEKK
jgi:hypothetical protein